MVGSPPTPDGKPLPPVGPARYAVAPRSRHAALLQEALDLLDPKQPLVWEGGACDAGDASDAVFCLRLPTREQFATLSQRGEPIIFVNATQLPYLRSIAAPLTPERLPSAADRAQGRAQAVRARIVQLLETRHLLHQDGDAQGHLRNVARGLGRPSGGRRAATGTGR